MNKYIWTLILVTASGMIARLFNDGGLFTSSLVLGYLALIVTGYFVNLKK